MRPPLNWWRAGRRSRRVYVLALIAAVILLVGVAALAIGRVASARSVETEQLHYESPKAGCMRVARYYLQTLHRGGVVRVHCAPGCTSPSMMLAGNVHSSDGKVRASL